MSELEIPIQRALIDSLTVFIPLNEIVIIDPRITAETVIYYPDLKDWDDLLSPPTPLRIETGSGITFRVNLVQFPNENFKRLRLVITTKYLREQYFEGIKMSNLDTVVDTINAHEAIFITRDVLLSSYCNDVDVCSNYHAPIDAYKKCLNIMHDKVKVSAKNQSVLFNGKGSPDNYGLQFGDRDSGSVRHPFVKWYNKYEELITKSATFYNIFLHPHLKYQRESIKNLRRRECTVKNARVKDWLQKNCGIDSKMKTFKDWLELPQQDLETIFRVLPQRYYEKILYQPSDKLSPTDSWISYTMHELILNGHDTTTILAMCNKTIIACKVQRSRFKKKLERLLTGVLEHGQIFDLEKENQPVNEFLTAQNLWDIQPKKLITDVQ